MTRRPTPEALPPKPEAPALDPEVDAEVDPEAARPEGMVPDAGPDPETEAELLRLARRKRAKENPELAAILARVADRLK